MTDWLQRFEKFASRKEQEAINAAISPFVTDEDHPSKEMSELGNEWSRALFDGNFRLSAPASDDLPATNVVFVRSREGNTVARDPSLLGGGNADKHLIYEGLSRVAVDGVLAGAETIRGGKMVLSVWHPRLTELRASLGKPRHPTQIVATLRGVDLDEGLIFNLPDLRVVLITVPQCMEIMSEALVQRPWIHTVVIDDTTHLRDAFRSLRAIGVERVSAIGGRTIATALIDAGLVDDLYLTTTPISAGEPNTPMYPGVLRGDVVVRKRGTGPDAGVVFEHLVRLKTR